MAVALLVLLLLLTSGFLSGKGNYYDTTDKQVLSATVANMDFNAVVTFNT